MTYGAPDKLVLLHYITTPHIYLHMTLTIHDSVIESEIYYVLYMHLIKWPKGERTSVEYNCYFVFIKIMSLFTNLQGQVFEHWTLIFFSLKT